MKYPRYSKSEDLRCKLILADIQQIRLQAKQGFSQKEIAERLRVSQSLIAYWLLNDQQRKQRNQRQYLLWEMNRDREDKKKRQRKSTWRKYHTMLMFRKYCLEEKHRFYKQKKLKNIYNITKEDKMK